VVLSALPFSRVRGGDRAVCSGRLSWNGPIARGSPDSQALGAHRLYAICLERCLVIVCRSECVTLLIAGESFTNCLICVVLFYVGGRKVIVRFCKAVSEGSVFVEQQSLLFAPCSRRVNQTQSGQVDTFQCVEVKRVLERYCDFKKTYKQDLFGGAGASS